MTDFTRSQRRLARRHGRLAAKHATHVVAPTATPEARAAIGRISDELAYNDARWAAHHAALSLEGEGR